MKLCIVTSGFRILEIIRERVPDHRASHSKSPAAVHAEIVMRYDQKMLTGGTKVLL